MINCLRISQGIRKLRVMASHDATKYRQPYGKAGSVLNCATVDDVLCIILPYEVRALVEMVAYQR